MKEGNSAQNIPRWFFDDKFYEVQLKITIGEDIQYFDTLNTEHKYFELFKSCFFTEQEDYISKIIPAYSVKKVYENLEEIKKNLSEMSTLNSVPQNNYTEFVLQNKKAFLVMTCQLQEWIALYYSVGGKLFRGFYEDESKILEIEIL